MKMLFGDSETATARPHGIAQHERVVDGKDEWLTPPEIIKVLGEFSLDPCSPVKRPWPTALKHFTVEENGLAQEWNGRVWLNPPYGAETGKWMERMARHGCGTALIFARTETETWFEWVWPKMAAVLFLKGRVAFYHVDGHRARTNAGAPSALIAYGKSDAHALRDSGIAGQLVTRALHL
jgi:DNA N-6-adenine-methyltransferase (Dam)